MKNPVKLRSEKWSATDCGHFIYSLVCLMSFVKKIGFRDWNSPKILPKGYPTFSKISPFQKASRKTGCQPPPTSPTSLQRTPGKRPTSKSPSTKAWPPTGIPPTTTGGWPLRPQNFAKMWDVINGDGIASPKLTARPWKLVVVRRFVFWETLYVQVLKLVSGRVIQSLHHVLRSLWIMGLPLVDLEKIQQSCRFCEIRICESGNIACCHFTMCITMPYYTCTTGFQNMRSFLSCSILTSQAFLRGFQVLKWGYKQQPPCKQTVQENFQAGHSSDHPETKLFSQTFSDSSPPLLEKKTKTPI